VVLFMLFSSGEHVEVGGCDERGRGLESEA
jgi:hypothetical protein